MESALSDLLLRMKNAKTSSDSIKQTQCRSDGLKNAKQSSNTNKHTKSSNGVKRKRKSNVAEDEVKDDGAAPKKQLKNNSKGDFLEDEASDEITKNIVEDNASEEITEVTPKIFKSFVRLENNALALDAENDEKRRKERSENVFEEDLKQSQLVQDLLIYTSDIEQRVATILQGKEKEIENLNEDREAFKKATIEEVAKFDAENKAKIKKLQTELEEAKMKPDTQSGAADKAYEKLEKKYKLLKERNEMAEVDKSVMDKELAEKEEVILNKDKEMADKDKEMACMTTELACKDKELADKEGVISKLREEVDELSGKLTQVIFSLFVLLIFIFFWGRLKSGC